MRKLPKWTPQLNDNHPAEIDLRWLRANLNCNNIADQDLRGWTTLHHICDSTGYCSYMAQLLEELVERPTANEKLGLPGDMDTALRTYTWEWPPKRTPLHILLDNSDSGMDANRIVQKGIASNLITKDILELKDPHVSIFCLGIIAHSKLVPCSCSCARSRSGSSRRPPYCSR